MTIAFVTTQSLQGSTVVGRVLPLAQELLKKYEVHVLVHDTKIASESTVPRNDGAHIRVVGKDPFKRTSKGKKRLSGISLISRMKINALRTVFVLLKIKPDVIIIVKPLPQNVLAVWWYRFLRRLNPSPPPLGNGRRLRIILDADDFELEAQKLSSIWQRAVVHWAEHKAVNLADQIVVATPFLEDHFSQLSRDRDKDVTMIPTGVSVKPLPSSPSLSHEALAKWDKGMENSLLYLGSISISSGHRVDLLPEILTDVKKGVPDVKLVMAGYGDDISTLKKQFEKKGSSNVVEWIGRFSHNDVPSLLERAAVLVDPIDASIVNRAKSSYRTTIAAAAGLPVVTSNVGIRPMLVPPSLHERFFAKPGDSGEYARKIVNLLQNPINKEERKRMQKHTEQWSWKHLAKRYPIIPNSQFLIPNSIQ